MKKSRVKLTPPVKVFFFLLLSLTSLTTGCATWPGFSQVCACLTAKQNQAKPSTKKPSPAKSNCPDSVPVITSATAQEVEPEAKIPPRVKAIATATAPHKPAPKVHATKVVRTSKNTTSHATPIPKTNTALQANKNKKASKEKTGERKAVAANIDRPTIAPIKKSKRLKSIPSNSHNKKTRILMLGDSMAATDFGRALQKKLNRHPKIKCFRKGKSSTGLARPDFFDWMSTGEAQIRRSNPDVVIVIVGGNDGQDLIDKAKKKRRIFWKGKKWAKAYAKRITDFIDLLKGRDREVLWLELPAMDHRRLEKKLKTIRQIQFDAVTKIESRVHYIPTRSHFYDSNDQLIRRIKVPRKAKKALLRQEDGIHFSLPGSRYFADKVYPHVLKTIKHLDD